MRLRNLAHGGIVCVAALLALPSLAGPSLERMQALHREQLGRTDAQPPVAPSGSITLLAGERPASTAAFIDEPVSGGPGLQIRQTLVRRDSTDLGLEVQLGAVANDGEDGVRLVGSSVSVPLGPGAAYVSYEPRHWGPGWFGSLILDGAAAPVAAIGWRTPADPFAPPPKWRADVFMGTLRGHTEPAAPRLIGMRLEWRPTPAWTLGLARTLQWGGSGRDESFDSLVRGLLGRDTKGRAGVDGSNEPGNQLAGLDVRFDTTVGHAAIGAYVQLVAEDMSTTVPSRRLRLGGVDIAAMISGVSLRAIAELAETTAGEAQGLAYRHHLYPAGYTHRGEPLGHPIGGDARLASAGLLLDRGPVFAMLALHYGRALPGAQRFVPGARLSGADIELAYTARDDLKLGVSAHRWHAGTAGTERWAQVWAQYSWP